MHIGDFSLTVFVLLVWCVIFKDIDVKFDLSCDRPHVLLFTLYNLFIYTNAHYVIVIID